MAGSASKSWQAGETVEASEMNALEANIFVTHDQNIGNPRTSTFRMAGYALVMDVDGDSTISSTTDDRIDLILGSVGLFRFDGTTSGCDSGFDFIASDLSGGNGDPSITVVSTETNCSLNLVPKGTGDLQVSGGSMSPLAWQVYGA